MRTLSVQLFERHNFLSDKTMNKSDIFRLKCLSFSEISAILYVLHFCFYTFSFNVLYRLNNGVESETDNPLTLYFESITLKHISEMFNDIFGEVLWKGLVEDKPPDPGEIQKR